MARKPTKKGGGRKPRKVAVVTGGGTGLGRDAANRLARDGLAVAVLGRRARAAARSCIPIPAMSPIPPRSRRPCARSSPSWAASTCWSTRPAWSNGSRSRGSRRKPSPTRSTSIWLEPSTCRWPACRR
ncbi:MAG: SDR family NAD(P)-dependent oxidoreductase [Alphaproteobacteria bacterium]|nr:SDR family NAD(P)-dependent oxidoreductase [Alphaproteobacteria bacterium]